jgi:hypothetical protein
MSNHFSMGAINKSTNKYEYPKIANKINKYKCPSCEKDIIFRNGKIKLPHFAHYKSTSPCSYYEKPNETQIHKDAKLLLKTLLDNKRYINIYRRCYYCYAHPKTVFNISDKEYSDNICVKLEYTLNHNNSKKIADVALLQNNELMFIFEVCHKNKTKEENRPEPWFEFKAETLINDINTGNNVNEKGEIKIECIRDYKCVFCKKKDEYERQREEYERQRLAEFIEQLRIKEEYERKKLAEIIENRRLKEIEQKLERYELSLMDKEDSRTIEIKMKIELEKELQRVEREKQRKIIEEEQENKRKEEEARRMREIEEWTHSPHNDERCDICNINYCKCLVRKMSKNKYNIIRCESCNKRRCGCARITDFFKGK